AVDNAGNFSFFTAPFVLTVDRTLHAPLLGLDPSFAAGQFGPGVHTTQQVVNLIGTAKAGAVVQVVGTPVQATADAHGNVTLAGVPLHLGVNTLQILTTDTAGNQVASQFTV